MINRGRTVLTRSSGRGYVMTPRSNSPATTMHVEGGISAVKVASTMHHPLGETASIGVYLAAFKSPTCSLLCALAITTYALHPPSHLCVSFHQEPSPAEDSSRSTNRCYREDRIDKKVGSRESASQCAFLRVALRCEVQNVDESGGLK